jgi:hypothetical protein
MEIRKAYLTVSLLIVYALGQNITGLPKRWEKMMVMMLSVM